MTMKLISSQYRNIQEILQQALSSNKISNQRYQTLLIESQKCIKDLVLLFQHHKSSSVGVEQYQRVVYVFNTYFMHGFKESEVEDLADYGIQFYVDQGKILVESKLAKIRELHALNMKLRIKTNNDRYNSILNEQIPRFLKTFEDYRGFFNVCTTVEDLDYPLFDGLPLEHDMYQSDGVDLVLYYMERFTIENRYCDAYKDEFIELINDYENCKGVKVELLSMNFCELCFLQGCANLCLHRNSILLSSKDKQYIKGHPSLVLKSIEKFFQELKQIFPNDLAEYFLQFKERVLFQFKQTFENGFDFLIAKEIEQYKTEVSLQSTVTSDCFEQYIEQLQHIEEWIDKLKYIKQEEIGVLDMLDLFEHGVFLQDEICAYFTTCSRVEKALYLKIAYPDSGIFNEKIELNQQFYQELNGDDSWLQGFTQMLMQLSEKDKEEITRLAMTLKIV